MLQEIYMINDRKCTIYFKINPGKPLHIHKTVKILTKQGIMIYLENIQKFIIY